MMQAISPDMGCEDQHGLFSGIVRDATPGERIQIVFGLMRSILDGMVRQNCPATIRAQSVRVIAAISFLRESLSDKPQDPFHDAFKRFYNHLHRQVIDAVRDRKPDGFAAASNSIGILISDAHANAFIDHCLEQSTWREHRLIFVLERLYSVAPRQAPAPIRFDKIGAFIPVRFA